MKQIGALQFGGAIGAALHIDEERKQNTRLFTKQARIVKIAHPNGREIRSTRLDFRFMLAQLRDVLAAEHSAVVTQENDNGSLRLPQRAKAHGPFVKIGKNDFRQLRAQAFYGHLFGRNQV